MTSPVTAAARDLMELPGVKVQPRPGSGAYIAVVPFDQASAARDVIRAHGLEVTHDDRYMLEAALGDRFITVESLCPALHGLWAIAYAALASSELTPHVDAAVLSALTGAPRTPVERLSPLSVQLQEAAEQLCADAPFGTPYAPTPTEDTLARLLAAAAHVDVTDTDIDIDDELVWYADFLVVDDPALVRTAELLTRAPDVDRSTQAAGGVRVARGPGAATVDRTPQLPL